MSKLYDGRKRTGYSAEEAYFHEENKRLISQMRKQNNKDLEAPIEDSTVIDARERFSERRAQASGKSGGEKSKDKKAA